MQTIAAPPHSVTLNYCIIYASYCLQRKVDKQSWGPRQKLLRLLTWEPNIISPPWPGKR